MSASKQVDRGRFGNFINTIEETFIALLLGLMVIVTFANVFLRYGRDTWVTNLPERLLGIEFPESIIWGQEVVTILFAWLVMFGMSYCVKITAHLGVDAVTNAVPDRAKRVMLLLSTVACVVYAMLLMKGAWDQYANYINLPETTGRWFPTGLQEMRPQDYQGYKPTIQVPMIEWLRGPLESYLFYWEDEEPFDKLPIAIPYFIIPFGAALLLFRILQAAVDVVRGKRDSLIVSHEAEEAVAEVAAKYKGN
ncbi:C4-dicarboxylate transporter, DctQ subunit [Cognatiyoonia koreensis]|uniref:TRAP transporter small permease protein n=1 Tax=Cognatiyoonia koreensis TaxID=364200 RepID=A0A1I0PQN7_9RHOB|nr:TRAP transporter small permease [Cognatiyoonia koreensis]SEW16672.1 C4-dicarboxylate transporter, DctQ subunit [Cognatiyoonia koreensis]